MNSLIDEPKTIPCFACMGKGRIWDNDLMPPTEGIEDLAKNLQDRQQVQFNFPQLSREDVIRMYQHFHKHNNTRYFQGNTTVCMGCNGTGETENPEIKR